MLVEIITRTSQTDPSCDYWCVNEQDVTVWRGGGAANSLATSIVIKNGESIAEDASKYQPVHENRYINLAELDAVLRGINLELQ